MDLWGIFQIQIIALGVLCKLTQLVLLGISLYIAPIMQRFLCSIYQEEELLTCGPYTYLILLNISRLYSRMVAQVMLPQIVCKGSHFPKYSSTFGLIHLFSFANLMRVVFCFHLHFWHWEWDWASFHLLFSIWSSPTC